MCIPDSPWPGLCCVALPSGWADTPGPTWQPRQVPCPDSYAPALLSTCLISSWNLSLADMVLSLSETCALIISCSRGRLGCACILAPGTGVPSAESAQQGSDAWVCVLLPERWPNRRRECMNSQDEKAVVHLLIDPVLGSLACAPLHLDQVSSQPVSRPGRLRHGQPRKVTSLHAWSLALQTQ